MILITGGAGFIGAHLTRLLCDAGEPVRVFELPDANVRHLPPGAEIVRGDIRDVGAVRAAVRGCRHVYHLAANPNLWAKRSADFAEVNAQGACNVLHAALDAGAERILHTSTESILAFVRDPTEPIETAALDRDAMYGPYCKSKGDAEQEAFRLAKQGAPVVVVNPTLPIGPGDHRLSPPSRMTLDFCQGKLPGYVDCWLNVIDARDVAMAMVAALTLGTFGRRYLLGNHDFRLIQWLHLLGEIVGRRPPRLRVPYPAAIAFAWLSERWANCISGACPKATVTGVRLTQRMPRFGVSPALKELGITPRPLNVSIHDQLDFFVDQNWLPKYRQSCGIT